MLVYRTVHRGSKEYQKLGMNIIQKSAPEFTDCEGEEFDYPEGINTAILPERCKYFFFFAEDAFKEAYRKYVYQKSLKYDVVEYNIAEELLIPNVGFGILGDNTIENNSYPYVEFAVPFEDLRKKYAIDPKITATWMINEFETKELIKNIYSISIENDCVKLPSKLAKKGYNDYILGEYRKLLNALNIAYKRPEEIYYKDGYCDAFNVSQRNVITKNDYFKIESILNNWSSAMENVDDRVDIPFVKKLIS